MSFVSKNMNYAFHVEYFEGLEKEEDNKYGLTNPSVEERNEALVGFEFPKETPMCEWRQIPGYKEFTLYTKYPGLLMGTGYAHDLAAEGAIKCGFSFDAITGHPFLPGSSLKGVLRSFFPGDGKDAEISKEYEMFIKGLLGKDEIDVIGLKENIFENNDLFLGAYPEMKLCKDRTLLEEEYITPHNKGQFKNPIPISLIKVKPNVAFSFGIVAHDYKSEDGIIVTAEEKLNLFKQIILLSGVGAKTNVGFGKFGEERSRENVENIQAPRQNRRNDNGQPDKRKPDTRHADKPHIKMTDMKCATPGCSNKVSINPKTDRPNKFCPKCFEKNRKNQGKK